MHPSSKIFVAGHNGLVGSALTRKLRDNGFSNLVERPRDRLDLTVQPVVDKFFGSEHPEYAFLAAAFIKMRLIKHHRFLKLSTKRHDILAN